MIMEEQTRHLLEVNKRFGNSLLSAVTLSQQSDAFVEEFKVPYFPLLILTLSTNTKSLLGLVIHH